jgi:uncharacterized protein
MSAHLIRKIVPAQYRQMPWRNGGGVTSEIAVFPEPEDGATAIAQPFWWRLSIAAVKESGPFSLFPGYDRTLLMLSGDGMELSFGEAAAPLVVQQSGVPVAFSGELPTGCKLLGGAVRDFNIMTMRGRVKSRTQVRDLSVGQSLQVLVAGGTAFVFVLQGNINVQAAAETFVHTLQAEETLRLDFPTPSTPFCLTLTAVTAVAQALIVELSLADAIGGA